MGIINRIGKYGGNLMSEIHDVSLVAGTVTVSSKFSSIVMVEITAVNIPPTGGSDLNNTIERFGWDFGTNGKHEAVISSTLTSSTQTVRVTIFGLY